MTAADALHALWEATLATSVAVLVVMALRGALRRGFGAQAAYAAWSLVPASLLAVLLPPPMARDGTAATSVVAVVSEVLPPAPSSSVATPTAAATWLLAAWLVGAGGVALGFAWRQRRFLRALGRLRRRSDGLFEAQAAAGLPAAIGVLRPRIVLPPDFDARYSQEEQRLLCEHERQHLAQGDLHFTALAVLLRTLFWFNPLLHWAAHHFRQDQELSCDQRVVARHPQCRRAYGEAMLKTQLSAQPWPLGCHWGFSHPLKERIAMLKQPLPSFTRWLSGGACVLALTLTGGYAAWAAQPNSPVASASEAPLMVQLDVRVQGADGRELSNPRVATLSGNKARIRMSAWQGWLHLVPTVQPDGEVSVTVYAAPLQGSPSLVLTRTFKVGETLQVEPAQVPRGFLGNETVLVRIESVSVPEAEAE